MSGAFLKKLLLTSLAVLLIAVWIRNLFLLVPATRVGESSNHAESSLNLSNLEAVSQTDTLFLLDLAIRDPFARPKKQQPNANKPVAVMRIPLTADVIHASPMGHVFNSGRPYIIALDSITGTSGLYRTGDTLNGFVLQKVTRTGIHWKSLKGHRIVWKTDS